MEYMIRLSRDVWTLLPVGLLSLLPPFPLCIVYKGQPQDWKADSRVQL